MRVNQPRLCREIRVDDIYLTDYDPRWPSMYEAEAKRLTAALPPSIMRRIEHFGSTAIPGLAAKPVIDILVAVCSIEEARRRTPALMEELGYAFWSENPKRDRLFFVKGLPPSAPHRTHHVHMSELDGEMWHRLLFRDYLRNHPDEAARYGVLKQNLAVRYRSDREAYTDAKSEYVDQIMATAVTEAAAEQEQQTLTRP